MAITRRCSTSCTPRVTRAVSGGGRPATTRRLALPWRRDRSPRTGHGPSGDRLQRRGDRVAHVCPEGARRSSGGKGGSRLDSRVAHATSCRDRPQLGSDLRLTRPREATVHRSSRSTPDWECRCTRTPKHPSPPVIAIRRRQVARTSTVSWCQCPVANRLGDTLPGYVPTRADTAASSDRADHGCKRRARDRAPSTCGRGRAGGDAPRDSRSRRPVGRR